MISVQLFTTTGCHLCELAATQLNVLKQHYPLTIEYVEIGDDDQLTEQYGVRIPVIKRSDNAELDWPFDLQQLHTFLQLPAMEL